MKRKLLFAAMFIASVLGVNAQTTIEVDYTSKLGIDAASWSGASGLCATNFAPAITTKDGRTAQLAENYQGNVNATGDLMTQTVTGLPNGTYRVSIYANAFYTSGRGFTSDMEDGADDVCYVFAGKDDNRQEQFIVAKIATETSENNLRTLNDVIVTDGTLVVGLGKAKAGTNWHTVQVYEITAVVDATELLEVANANYEAVKDKTMQASVKSALEAAKTAVDNAVTAETLNAFNDAINAAEASAAAYEAAGVKLTAMKAVVDATNFYTVDAYNAYYGDAQSKFEAFTLTTEEANALQNPSVITGWRAATTVDNFLLSVWDVEPDFAGDYYINTWSAEGESDGSDFKVPFFEYWTGDGNSLGEKTLTATIENVEADATYAVDIWARVRQTNSQTKVDGGITLQVGEGKTVDLTQGVQVGSSQFYLDHFTAVGKADADGKLVVKINVAAASNVSWLSFKDVVYTKYDDPRIPLAAQLNTLVASAEALYGQLPSGTEAALVATVDANKKEWETVEQYEGAIDVLDEAVKNAQSIVAPYAAWLALKANADALAAAENDNATANATLKGAIDTYADVVTNATIADDIQTAIDNLKADMTDYAYAANPVGEAQFDLTFMLTNPDLTGLKTWAPADGWAGENAGNSQVMKSDDVKASDGKNYFYEFWSNNPYDNGKFNLYLTVELPAGTYQMECLAFAQCAANSSTSGQTPVANGISFSANDTDGSYITSLTLDDASLTFVNKETQDVKIGLKAQAGNNRTWMGIGYVKMYKIPAEDAVELNEAVAYVEEAKAADVKLTRTIYEGFNTVVLPFSMTADEIATVFGAGTLYQFDDADAGVLNFSEATALAPHIPFLFKADAAKSISEETIAGRTITISTNNLTKAGTDYNFVGTYAPLVEGNDVITAADFVLGADKFVIAKGGNALKAFRAFIQANEEVAPVKALTINLDGVATAIEAIDGKAIANGAIYNLAGQRVSKAQKGIFIQNGKKVIK